MAETKTTTKTATTAKKTTSTAKASTSSTKTTATKSTTKATTTKKATAPKAAAKVEAPVVEEVKAEVAPVEVKAEPAKKVAKGPMLQIKLVKSKSGRLEKQIKTLTALGLNKINQTVVKPDNAATRGMIFVVKHLVEVTEIK